MAIVLHSHKTLLCQLPDLWLSLYVRFIPYINCAFCFDTDPAMSSQGTRTGVRTNEWDITAEQTFSCLCNELKRSVDKSGRLDDTTQIASEILLARVRDLRIRSGSGSESNQTTTKLAVRGVNGLGLSIQIQFNGNPQPVWIGRVVSGLSSRCICRFI